MDAASIVDSFVLKQKKENYFSVVFHTFKIFKPRGA